jgi:TolB-like protein
LKNIVEPVAIYKIILPGSVENTNLVTVQQQLQALAVLPFANRNGDADSEYFSDGLTDDITSQLNRIGDLKVISRTSAMQFKNTDQTTQEIGRALGVSSILEGSVRQQGNRVRIVAQLVDVASGEQVWSEHYDRQLVDIFEIQIEVAEKIADALPTRISRPDRERMERTKSHSGGAL